MLSPFGPYAHLPKGDQMCPTVTDKGQHQENKQPERSQAQPFRPWYPKSTLWKCEKLLWYERLKGKDQLVNWLLQSRNRRIRIAEQAPFLTAECWGRNGNDNRRPTKWAKMLVPILGNKGKKAKMAPVDHQVVSNLESSLMIPFALGFGLQASRMTALRKPQMG
jgi:hypothetical protein